MPENITGLPGLLVLRDRKTGELLPVRWCTGVRKENFGEFIFFDFQFDSIFDVTSLKERLGRSIVRLWRQCCLLA
jgi:hypothetical protein